MKEKYKAIFLMMAMMTASSAFAAKSVPVAVKDGNQNLQGDLWIPDHASGSLPLVVVVHEWWGKTDYPEMRGRKIADELGYAALVVDLYGEGKTASTPQDAQALAGPFYQDPLIGVRRLQEFIAAAPTAANQTSVSLDLSKIAAIGYCFGGTQVLNLARADRLPQNEKLLGVVSFHGGLASSLKAQPPIKTKLLVLHGAADQLVKPEEVAAFKEEMKRDGADLEFKAYPGAIHAFTNPKATEIGKKYGIPVAYDAKADKDSWKRMTEFLKRIFRSSKSS